MLRCSRAGEISDLSRVLCAAGAIDLPPQSSSGYEHPCTQQRHRCGACLSQPKISVSRNGCCCCKHFYHACIFNSCFSGNAGHTCCQALSALRASISFRNYQFQSKYGTVMAWFCTSLKTDRACIRRKSSCASPECLQTTSFRFRI